MPHAKVNGIDLYYERHGEAGEPLVFVHGYTGDITDWRFQVPEFARTHRVLIFDNRGHGRSEAPADRTSYTIEQMADDAEALIEYVGFERYHLLGHSMGGAIAQEIALRNPARLLSLTLEDTSYRFAFNRSPAMSQFLALRHRIAQEQGMAAVAALPQVVPSPPHMPADRKAETDERLARMSVDAFLGAWAALENWPGTEERLRALAVPALLIYGDLDAPPLVEAMRRMALLIPKATLEVVPEAGHSPQYERPALFNAAVRRHVDQQAMTAAR